MDCHDRHPLNFALSLNLAHVFTRADPGVERWQPVTVPISSLVTPCSVSSRVCVGEWAGTGRDGSGTGGYQTERLALGSPPAALHTTWNFPGSPLEPRQMPREELGDNLD